MALEKPEGGALADHGGYNPGEVSQAMSTIRIMLAEDHAVVREGTRNLLEQEPDFEVVGEAATGVEAVEVAGREHPDVAIVDIGMPEMNGIEATRQIKARWPDINVLVLTAYDDDEYVFAFVEAGAAGYLLKDVPAEEVIRAVRAVHAGESVLHPAVMKKLMARFAGQPGSGSSGPTEVELLSEREREVLTLAARGLTNALIGDELSLSPRTVQTHMRNIFNKLRVSSRTEAVVSAVRRGLIDIADH